MRLPAKKLLPEPETSESILAELRGLASNPKLRPEVRDQFEQLVILYEQIPYYEDLWDKVAEEFGLHEHFQTLPDEEIAAYRVLPQDGEEDKLLELIKTRLLEPNRKVLVKLPGWDERDFLGHWCGVFRTALVKEYLRRRDQNENDDGRLIRVLLVQESDRGEILKKAAKSM